MNTVELWVSRVLVVGLVGLIAVLTITVLRTAEETITVDIRCLSGNPVVGVWIQATEGGSGWAARGTRKHRSLDSPANCPSAAPTPSMLAAAAAPTVGAFPYGQPKRTHSPVA